MTAPRESPTAELWSAVDRLVKPSRVRLVRDSRRVERVTLPSLFDQLVDAIETGTGSAAHGVQTSKPPLDVMALALLIEIAATVRSGCWNWHLKRTRDTPKDLRQIATAVIGYGDVALIDATARKVYSWGTRIRTVISSDPDRTWRMHGAACRVCSSTTVPAFSDDGEETRQPALIVHSEDGVIDRVECGFCGSTLTGDDLTALVHDTLTAAAGVRKLA